MAAEKKIVLIEEDGAIIWLFKSWLPKKEADILMEKLDKEVAWEQAKVTVFGKVFDEPRTTHVCGAEGVVHRYSGVVRPMNPWVPDVEDIKKKLEKELGKSLNACLLNRYKDGNDVIGSHSDKELSPPDHLVATVSLGGPRDFIFDRKKKIEETETRKNKIKLSLESGDCVVMMGTTQQHWLHSVPKRAHANKRISLTYRLLEK